MSTDPETPLSARDLIDLHTAGDAMCEIVRKLIIISAIAAAASSSAEPLGGRERSTEEEKDVVLLVYELERQITACLAFARVTDRKFFWDEEALS